MILVSGVNGNLGGLVHRQLVARGADVLAGTRTPAAGQRRVDFDDPTSLPEAFAGVDVLVLISAGYAEDDVVLARHGAAIDAAAAAGVRQVIYTSLAGSGDHLTIAIPHRWTEQALARSPLAWTVLRNGLYPEVPAGLGLAASGQPTDDVLRTPLGHGTVPVVSRADLADAAVRVALDADSDPANQHRGRVYELEGTAVVGGAELAAAVSEVLGRPVRHRASPLGELWSGLEKAGLAPFQVAHAYSLMSTAAAGLLRAAANSDLPALLDAAPRDARAGLVEAVRTLLPR
ncbi:NmrA family transcriptional regulator [Kitasatospora acidiphila]|uniref:NmrA family transcriptional regulator n=1 Tax=Kitasatospora acidiphila TaxID=2567942 RepID=A0A540W4M7_9ACTN|nr:NAD(P)H-binding protein [Kitasatospora acidiphila]TQF03995.1 NmrA family transcriptional regulator [Kitasatospora acidiphila]